MRQRLQQEYVVDIRFEEIFQTFSTPSFLTRMNLYEQKVVVGGRIKAA
jgi:hypothetical protein